MPEYLSPGVYVEEFDSGAQPIEGVGTSTAGFLGETLRGPLYPKLVTGFEQFKRIYGSFLDNNRFLAYAINGFFANGGQRCYVGRVVGPLPDDAPETADGVASAIHSSVRFDAVGPGAWGNRIAVKISAGGLQNEAASEPWDKVKLAVMYWDVAPPNDPFIDPTDPTLLTHPNRREPDRIEVYDNLTNDPTSVDYWEKRINLVSDLIIINFTEGQPNPTSLPLTLLTGLPGVINAGIESLSPDLGSYTDSEDIELPDGRTLKTGLKGFEQVDEIAIVVAPNHHELGTNLTDVIVQHCERQGDRFAVFHANKSTQPGAAGLRPPHDTSYAGFYYPWIRTFDIRTKQDLLIPPSGHVAGIYAKTDVERGVHKAPANVVISGANGLEFVVTKGEHDILNPRGVNVIRSFPGRGIRVWGARTSSSNSLWKYINVRRLFLFLRESIDEGTQWVVFEPNDERLWARIRQTITQFLTTVWRDGALMGLTAEEAFFVKCDRTTMTQDDIDNGRLICIIGVAPVKPAEFVIFRITQFTSNANS